MASEEAEARDEESSCAHDVDIGVDVLDDILEGSARMWRLR